MFIGELIYQGRGCGEFSPRRFAVPELPESYLAMTPTAAECVAEQIGRSTLGKYSLNELFNDTAQNPITSSSL